MIEEVSELSGVASPLTPAPIEATAAPSDAPEKPKRRRVAAKTADATLPLEGVSESVDAPEKPKRAVRRKKTDESADDAPASGVTSATGEVAPEKPKRVVRRKKTDEAVSETAPANEAATAPASRARTSAPSAENSANPGSDAPARSESAPAVRALDQELSSGPAPLQVAPAAAMDSFTPSPAQAQTEVDALVTRTEREKTENGRENRRDNSRIEARSEAPARDENGESAPDKVENQSDAKSEEGADDDDFRGRLSYRDRRAMRREQRIVSRGNGNENRQEEGETEAPTEMRGPRNRDSNREAEPRENDNRGERNNNRGERNDNRGERTDNRNNNRGERTDNRNDNRAERNNNRNDRNTNRGERTDNRNERNNNRNERGDNRNGDNRNDNRAEREPRENRRERNGSRGREFDLTQLQEMDGEALMAVVAELNMEEAPGEKEALLYAILEAQAHAQNAILKTGILDILPDGKGFMRCENYYPSEGDVYVSQTQIKRFGLKTGDQVLGTARVPKENERYHGLLRVESINGLSIETSKLRRDFEKLTPIFPTERFPLETDAANITARIIDLVSPIGKGQRGLIVAPPKAGKTTLIKNIANSITENNPEVILFVLLIDERPEEVTDISRSVRGEVVASTFDEVPENHIRVSDIVMERAKRLVEMGHDVVVLMDSITRLSRASNLVVAPSGRTMSGGLDPAAMYKPKRHFGAARNIEHGGSLTVLATVLVDTGSRMDEYIFEELKGTGNLDLVLDRDLFNQRIFPAIDINRSGTRRDELLLSKEELAATFHLRRTLAALDNDKAVTLLIDRLKNTKTNADFMEVVAKSQRNSPA